VITSKALARKIFAPILATLMVAGLSTGLASPVKAAETKQVIFHYQDPAATSFDDYKNLDFYFWGGASGDFAPNGSDSFGKVLTLNVDATATSMAGLIKYGWTNDWSKKVACNGCTTYSNDADRAYSLNATGSTELWIVKGVDTAAFSTRSGAVTAGALNTHSAWAAGDVDPNFDCVGSVCEPHIDMPATQTVTIHYNRGNAGFSGYKGWQIYQFNGGDVWFNGSDSFGKVYTRTLTNASKTTTYGFIMKTPSWTKDSCTNCAGDGNGDRIITLDKDGSTEVWVVSGADEQYYTTKTAAVAAGAGSADWSNNAVDPYFDCTAGVCLPAPRPASQTIKIHYNRKAGDYTGWNIWMWGTGTSLDTRTVAFTGTDSYGKVAVLEVPGDATNLTGFGFLLRDTDSWDTAKKNHPDNSGVDIKSIANGNTTGVTEVWIKQGDATAYDAMPFKQPTISLITTALPGASTSPAATSAGPGKAVTVVGTNLEDVNSVKVVRAAIPAVTAAKVGTAWKCGTTVRTQGYVCASASPAATIAANTYKVLSSTKLVFSLPSGEALSGGKLVIGNPVNSVTSTGTFARSATASEASISTGTSTSGVVGDTVTVKGSNVGVATAVALGDISITAFTIVAANELTFVVPDGAVDGAISVTTAAGTKTKTSNYALKPSVTSATATSIIGGTVTVTGVNLLTVSAVKIGTKSLPIVSKGATTITATVESGTSTGKVTVTSPGGTATAPADTTITPVPVISSFSGTKSGTKFVKGATITLTGTGLAGATEVLVGASSVAFTQVSSTSITFTAPAGITSKPVTVTTPGGQGSKTSFSTTS